MAYGDERALFPTPGRNPSLLGRGIGLPRFGCPMRHFHQRLTPPSTALARLAAEAFAATFIMARAHPRPGGQMLGTRKPGHIGPDFGQQDLRCALTHPRNAVQQGNRLVLGRQVLSSHRTNALDGFIQVIDLAELLGQQEPVVGCEIALQGLHQSPRGYSQRHAASRPRPEEPPSWCQRSG